MPITTLGDCLKRGVMRSKFITERLSGMSYEADATLDL